MIEAQREKLNINKLISEKKEIIIAEGDMIVPDSKPDILNTICTSGVVSVYRKEPQEGKVRIDGTVNTYIMYMPDGEDDTVRSLNKNVDFSENINMEKCEENANVVVETKVKNIETKVLNGRKINIKISLEVSLKVYSQEDIEIVTEMPSENDIQILKESLNVNSLVGQGETKINCKENVAVDASDNLAELLNVQVALKDRDIKISYNKVLTKAELEIKAIYITEDNRIGKIIYRIPVVGFVDIQNVNEENVCDVNYEIKNIIIKPNSQEEHSICVEAEIGVSCFAYEEKQINLIQDMYSPNLNLVFDKRQIVAMNEKKNISNVRQVKEKINLRDINDLNLIEVQVVPEILNESKINSKVLYEAELNMQFIFENAKSQIIIKEAKVPFDITIDNLQNGEQLNINSNIEIRNQDFIIENDGDVVANLEVQLNASMCKRIALNTINNIEEDGEREEQDYSIIIYVVKKGDTLWNIAKEFGSTIDSIVRVNGIEDSNKIYPNQKLYIPKFARGIEKKYE